MATRSAYSAGLMLGPQVVAPTTVWARSGVSRARASAVEMPLLLPTWWMMAATAVATGMKPMRAKRQAHLGGIAGNVRTRLARAVASTRGPQGRLLKQPFAPSSRPDQERPKQMRPRVKVTFSMWGGRRGGLTSLEKSSSRKTSPFRRSEKNCGPARPAGPQGLQARKSQGDRREEREGEEPHQLSPLLAFHEGFHRAVKNRQAEGHGKGKRVSEAGEREEDRGSES